MSDPGGTSHLRPDMSGPAQPRSDRFEYTEKLRILLFHMAFCPRLSSASSLFLVFWFYHLGKAGVPFARFKGKAEVTARFWCRKDDGFSSCSSAKSFLSLTPLKQHHRRNYDERATFKMNATEAGRYTLRTKGISSAFVRRGVYVIYVMLWIYLKRKEKKKKLLSIAAQFPPTCLCDICNKINWISS